MDERVVQFRVGVVVLATAIITAILVLLFGEAPTLVRGQYTIKIKLPRAPGIAVDTPVRKSGILIGRVHEVGFTEDGQVQVTARINDDIQLRRSERCRVKGSLLGDAVLEFTPTDDPVLAKQLIKDGDVMEGLVSSDPLEILD